MTSGDPRYNRVLVCFAVKQEARFFRPSPNGPTAVTVAITGMGRQNAARAIRSLVADPTPSFVLTCGFAGALNPNLPHGTIVFSADESLDLSPALVQLGAKPARFHCSPSVVVTSVEKQQLWDSTRADAVEMESEIIRQLCRERRIPSATVRVISDAADEDLPLDFNLLMTPEQKLSYPRLAVALLQSPGRIPALIRLQRRTTAAARRLGECLHAVLA